MERNRPAGSLRVVLDTNVLVSALHFTEGALADIWPPLTEGRYCLILSPAIIAELAITLRTKFGWEEAELQRTLRVLVRKAETVRPQAVIEVVPEDPDDDEIIACALFGRADLIVSGDRHLLALKEHKGIPIVRPVDFLRIVGGVKT